MFFTINFFGVVLVLILFFVMRGRVRALEIEVKRLKEAQRSSTGAKEEMPLRTPPEKQTVYPDHRPHTDHEDYVVHKKPTVGAPTTMVRPERVTNGVGPTTSVDDDVQDPITRFIDWFKDDWPMKVGALLLLVALGWLVSYAFINDWIGPTGRVTLGFVTGVFVLVLGAFRSKHYLNQGVTLLLLGGAINLISIYASVSLYSLFSGPAGLVVMGLVLLYLAFNAKVLKHRILGTLALLIGGYTPVVISPDANELIMFAYLFVLSLSTLWLVFFSGWGFLLPIAQGIVALYSIAFLFSISDHERMFALVFAFVFTALFYTANIGRLMLKRSLGISDGLVCVGTGFLFLYWMMVIVPEEWLSLVVVFGALLFSLSAYSLYRITKKVDIMIVFAVVSALLVIAATAIEFEKGYQLVIAYLLEATVLVLLAYYLSHGRMLGKVSVYTTILYILPVLMSLPAVTVLLSKVSSSSGTLRTPLSLYSQLWDDFLVMLVVIFTSLLLAGGIQKMMKIMSGLKGVRDVVYSIRVYFSIAGVYTLLFVWFVLHMMIADQYLASMVGLIFFTMLGVIFYLRGKIKDDRVYRVIGGLLFGAVIVRLFFVEFWEMNIVARIITFSVIGVLLLSTAFFARGNKEGEIPKED